MSVWVTEEVMRRTLRFCSHGSQLIQHSVVIPLGKTLTPHYSHIRDQKQNRKCYLIPVRSVRFYTQGPINARPETRPVSSSSSPKEDSPLHIDTQSAVVAPTVQSKAPSPFTVQLQGCASPSDVLDIVLRQPLTARQVSLCLTRMWALIKRLSPEQQPHELQLMTEHPAYNGLLQRAMEDAQHMSGESLAFCILGLVNLGVPQNSRVMQTLLRTCQAKVNGFDEKELSVLASCLPLLENSNNVIALKKGLRLIVEARLPSIQNVVSLQKMMRMLGKEAPESLKHKLERRALSMSDQFSLPNAQQMISVMASMGFLSKPLMDICAKRILDDIHGIPFNRLVTLLQAFMELGHKEKNLFTGISDSVASTIDLWTNRQVFILLSTFERLGFCPELLMRAFAERVIDNPDVLTLKDIQCALKVYSSLNYDLQHLRQPFLDGLSRGLESYLSKMSAYMLLKAVSRLCLLGHFPPAPVEHLLQDSTLEMLSNTSHKLSQSQTLMLQTVDLCLRLDRPPLPRPLSVPSSFLEDAGRLKMSAILWPSQVLQQMLGNRTDMKLEPAVMVENCYFIDAVITNSQTSQTSVTERSGGNSPAVGGQKIAVICTKESNFCFGTTDPRAHLAVKLRHLKLLGYDPVLVPQKELHDVSKETCTELLSRLNVLQHHRSEPQTE